MAEVLVALGSNVGQAEQAVRTAAEILSEFLTGLQLSSLYRTAPMYVTDQAPFINACIRGETSMGPLALYRRLKEIEEEMGRVARQRNGPREIDLDLLAYGALDYRFVQGDRDVLIVPHPRIPERRFVLAPAADVAPNFVFPGLGRVIDLLEQTNHQACDVERL